MSRVIDRWIRDHEVMQGDYSALAGFEADLRDYREAAGLIHLELDIATLIGLFGFVCKLLEEESCDE
jgi:hypothetical protein